MGVRRESFVFLAMVVTVAMLLVLRTHRDLRPSLQEHVPTAAENAPGHVSNVTRQRQRRPVARTNGNDGLPRKA